MLAVDAMRRYGDYTPGWKVPARDDTRRGMPWWGWVKLWLTVVVLGAAAIGACTTWAVRG